MLGSPPPSPTSAIPVVGSLWQRPKSIRLGSTPIQVLPVNPNRLGFWLWAAAPSISAGGITATGPAAGVTVAQLASLPPGYYDVTVGLGFTVGTPAAADGTNFQLVLGNLVISTSFATPISINQPTARAIRVMVDKATNLTLQVTANATSGVAYEGELDARPLWPAFFGFDQQMLANAYGEASGWPITDSPAWYPISQNLYAMTPQANPVDVRLIEVLVDPGVNYGD